MGLGIIMVLFWAHFVSKFEMQLEIADKLYYIVLSTMMGSLVIVESVTAYKFLS